MDEEINMLLSMTKEGMEKAIAHLDVELAKIRAGKANPSMLDSVVVDYYGTPTPLNQVGNVNTLDARTISVQPWEKPMLEEIEKAITNANLGLNPQNNGEMVIINVPTLTEERRMELVKRAKNEGENAKVSIRNDRKEANDGIKKMASDGLAEDAAKDAEARVQEQTDAFTAKVDALVEAKEKDIMTV